METVKTTDEYEILKKSSGRYAVRNAKRQWVNGDEKVRILLAEKLIKAAPPKAPEPVAEEAPVEAEAQPAPEEAAETPEAPAPEAEATAEPEATAKPDAEPTEG